MKTLANNTDLYRYLLGLSAELKQRGVEGWSQKILHASHYAASSGTELLGESRIVLKDILQEDKGKLTETERTDIQNVLNQINNVFEKRKK